MIRMPPALTLMAATAVPATMASQEMASIAGKKVVVVIKQ